MQYVDAHCHIDLYNDPAKELADATAADVGILAVTNAPFVYKACCQLARSRSNVWVAVGLHPELAHRYAHQVEDLVEQLAHTRFVGEVGLDYCVTDPGTQQLQRSVFETILTSCRSRSDTIVSIHSRKAESDVVSMIGRDFPGKPILHWYSGASRHLDLAQENGCYFSVNASMLRSKNGQRLIAKMDRSRVLTESDGPFAKQRGQRDRPCNMPSTIIELGKLWREDSATVRSRILDNWSTVLKA